jgi:hypothetical protein
MFVVEEVVTSFAAFVVEDVCSCSSSSSGGFGAEGKDDTEVVCENELTFNSD